MHTNALYSTDPGRSPDSLTNSTTPYTKPCPLFKDRPAVRCISSVESTWKYKLCRSPQRREEWEARIPVVPTERPRSHDVAVAPGTAALVATRPRRHVLGRVDLRAAPVLFPRKPLRRHELFNIHRYLNFDKELCILKSVCLACFQYLR